MKERAAAWVSVFLCGTGVLSCAAPRSPTSAVPSVAANDAPALAATEAGYTLAAGSGRLVRSLKSAVLVDAYVVRGRPELDDFAGDLLDLLKAYERQGPGKFKFRVLEANTDALREQAKEEGLQEQPQGYLGLVFRYGSEKAVIPALNAELTEGLEFWITNKLREIRDRADGIQRRIGVVTGKDELKLDDTNLVAKQGANGGPSIQGIFAEAFPYYRLEETDLKQGAGSIDPNLAGLIITQPQKDYTEPELRRIDEFMMRGEKSLVVFASAVNLKPNDPTLLATLSTRGLEPLLDGYGLHLNKDAVFDHGAQLRIPVISQEGQSVSLRHPGIAYVVNDPRMGDEKRRLDTSFTAFFHMTELLFPFSSSLELWRDKQPADVQLQIVARSTAEASVETSPTVDMKLHEQWQPKPPLQQRILAAYAQGKLKSAFASPARAPRSSRVLLISSSEFLTNPFAYAGNGTGSSNGDAQLLLLAQPYTKYLTSTILSVKNTLDWMTGDEDLVALSAKLVGPSRKKR